MAQGPQERLKQATNFGKYHLISSLSTGGMAELFIALQEGVEGFSKVVAVKRTLPHLADNEDFVQMFLNEARLASRLDHPNIVQIYDLGQVDRSYFMAMEYLPGEDLNHIIRLARKANKLINTELACCIIQSAADGLQYAHQLGDANGNLVHLVHRDVSPSNIIVTYHGNVKVVDFGIAKATDSGLNTKAGAIKGKMAYVAPEQVRGEPVDQRSDIFCLGIVLWEMLTLQRLFARDNDTATLGAVLQCDTPPVSKYRAVSPLLESIIGRALARDPAARYQNAREFSDALQEHFTTRTVRPSPKDVARWLTDLFTERRAAAKLGIATGSNLRASLQEISSGHGEHSFALPPTPDVRRPKTPSPQFDVEMRDSDVVRSDVVEAAIVPPTRDGLVRAALFAGFGLACAALISAAVITSSSPVEAPIGKGPPSLSIDSVPPGAFIFLNGELTGRQTPATLPGLSSGRSLQVSVEKAGFVTQRASFTLRPGEKGHRSFVLDPMPGMLILRGVPSGSRLMIDGQPAASNESLQLSAGPHQLQLVTGSRISRSQTVEILPGEQTFDFSK